MITVSLSFKDSNEGPHSSTSAQLEREVYYDGGEDPLSVFGDFINSFFFMAGYRSFNKDTVMIESITEDEKEYLENCLYEYRKENLKKE